MAISFPRTLPTSPGIRDNVFGINWNVDEFTSPVTLQSNFDVKQGHRWEGVFILPPMLPAVAAEWKAWFASLRGKSKTFFAFDPDAKTPFGIADTGSDTPLVKGAGQIGSSVISDAWRLSGIGLLVPGDYIQIDTHLAQVTEQFDSNGAGDGTIEFEPPFHIPPVDNAAIIFENPKGIFRLDTNKQEWDSDRFGKTDFAFSFVESF